MSEFKDYENKYLVRDYVNFQVVPLVYEVLVDSYGLNEEDYDGDVNSHVFEIIDGLEDVIYNYQARKIVEAFDMDPFGESPLSGERYSSYNQMVFELIEEKFYDKYSEQLEDVM